LAVGEFVTGLVVAVKGHVEGGVLTVADVCVAGLPSQEEGPEEGAAVEVEGEGGGGNPRYVMLASGECLQRREGRVAGGREGGREAGRKRGKEGRDYVMFHFCVFQPSFPHLLVYAGFKLNEKSDLLPLQMLIEYVQGHVGSDAHKRDVS